MNQSGSERKEIHRFEKNALEEVRVSLSTFKGRQYLDIRAYYQGDDGQRHPSKKGITLSLDLIPELDIAIRKLREASGPQREDG